MILGKARRPLTGTELVFAVLADANRLPSKDSPASVIPLTHTITRRSPHVLLPFYSSFFAASTSNTPRAVMFTDDRGVAWITRTAKDTTDTTVKLTPQIKLIHPAS